MPDLLLRGGRPWGVNAPADVLIREGIIERVGPDLRADPAAEVVDVPGRLLLPGLIDAHCHVDKTLFEGRWVPHSAGPALADRIAEERRRRAELGLPERLVWRQPFPGPGLAIRVVGGEATKERLDVLRDADYILQDEIRKAGLYRELWQSFCVLPAVRSVGVQGDERTYAYPIVIRAVTSDDAMTADWARLPYDLLETVSSRIINEIPHVNRVALDISSKPPSTIEWE